MSEQPLPNPEAPKTSPRVSEFLAKGQDVIDRLASKVTPRNVALAASAGTLFLATACSSAEVDRQPGPPLNINTTYGKDSSFNEPKPGNISANEAKTKAVGLLRSFVNDRFLERYNNVYVNITTMVGKDGVRSITDPPGVAGVALSDGRGGIDYRMNRINFRIQSDNARIIIDSNVSTVHYEYPTPHQPGQNREAIGRSFPPPLNNFTVNSYIPADKLEDAARTLLKIPADADIKRYTFSGPGDGRIPPEEVGVVDFTYELEDGRKVTASFNGIGSVNIVMRNAQKTAGLDQGNFQSRLEQSNAARTANVEKARAAVQKRT